MHQPILFMLAALLITPAVAHSGVASVSDLAWLSGCWASEDGEPGSGEQWTAPAGGTLLGLSRTVKEGRTVASEFMRITETESGTLVLSAHPFGQQEASFDLLELGDARVVFENLAHDFPQRIIYRRDDGGVLRARIEGVRNGKSRAADFLMSRTSCD